MRIEGDLRHKFLIVSDCVGPRADQGHFSAKHIEQLRKLVEAQASQEPSNSGHAGIVRACLGDDIAILQAVHCAEFEDVKWVLVESVSPLTEEHRSLRVHLNGAG